MDNKRKYIKPLAIRLRNSEQAFNQLACGPGSAPSGGGGQCSDGSSASLGKCQSGSSPEKKCQVGSDVI
jgi:hypothetical protein